jgi:hypothetical protein
VVAAGAVGAAGTSVAGAAGAGASVGVAAGVQAPKIKVHRIIKLISTYANFFILILQLEFLSLSITWYSVDIIIRRDEHLLVIPIYSHRTKK